MSQSITFCDYVQAHLFQYSLDEIMSTVNAMAIPGQVSRNWPGFDPLPKCLHANVSLKPCPRSLCLQRFPSSNMSVSNVPLLSK